jgi:hypothetical protein
MSATLGSSPLGIPFSDSLRGSVPIFSTPLRSLNFNVIASRDARSFAVALSNR